MLNENYLLTVKTYLQLFLEQLSRTQLNHSSIVSQAGVNLHSKSTKGIISDCIGNY